MATDKEYKKAYRSKQVRQTELVGRLISNYTYESLSVEWAAARDVAAGWRSVHDLAYRESGGLSCPQISGWSPKGSTDVKQNGRGEAAKQRLCELVSAQNICSITFDLGNSARVRAHVAHDRNFRAQ